MLFFLLSCLFFLRFQEEMFSEYHWFHRTSSQIRQAGASQRPVRAGMGLSSVSVTAARSRTWSNEWSTSNWPFSKTVTS